MSSYSYVKTVYDNAALLSYISKTLSTVTAVNSIPTGISISFSVVLSTGQQTTLTALLAAYPDTKTGTVDQVQLADYNFSTVPLGAAGVFTAPWEDVSRYATILVSVLSSAASAASGLSVQFGIAAQQTDVTRTFTVAAGVSSNIAVLVPGRWMRLVYTNGAVAQTSFTLQAKYSVVQVNLLTDGSTVVDDTLQAGLQRCMIMGRTDVGTYGNLRVDEERRLRTRPYTESAMMSAANSSPIVQISYTYSINTDTSLVPAPVAAGAVTWSSGTAVVSTSAAATSSAVLRSKRYVGVGVGRVIRLALACSFNSGVANSTQIVGMGTDENGLFVGYNGTAFGVMVRNNSVSTWVSSFNIDKLDGTGSSALTLDPTKGNVYFVTYDTSGFGSVTFAVGSGASDAAVFHRITFGNSASAVALRNFAGPLTASATNSTNTTAISLRVAGWSAFTDGVPRLIGALRGADISRSIFSTTYIPVLSILNKTSYQSVTNCLSAYLKQLSISCDGTKGAVVVSIWDGVTLTGATYIDVSTVNSSVQVDTSAAAMSGGTLLCSFTVTCRGDRQVDLTGYDLSLSPGNSYTIACRNSLSGVACDTTVATCWYEDN